jgi:hypothetical protein
MTFRSRSVATFSCAIFGEAARERPDADFESDSVGATDVDCPAALLDFPDRPGLVDELADAAGRLVFGCRVARAVAGGNSAVRTC